MSDILEPKKPKELYNKRLIIRVFGEPIIKCMKKGLYLNYRLQNIKSQNSYSKIR